MVSYTQTYSILAGHSSHAIQERSTSRTLQGFPYLLTCPSTLRINSLRSWRTSFRATPQTSDGTLIVSTVLIQAIVSCTFPFNLIIRSSTNQNKIDRNRRAQSHVCNFPRVFRINWTIIGSPKSRELQHILGVASRYSSHDVSLPACLQAIGQRSSCKTESRWHHARHASWHQRTDNKGFQKPVTRFSGLSIGTDGVGQPVPIE